MISLFLSLVATSFIYSWTIFCGVFLSFCGEVILGDCNNYLILCFSFELFPFAKKSFILNIALVGVRTELGLLRLFGELKLNFRSEHISSFIFSSTYMSLLVFLSFDILLS